MSAENGYSVHAAETAGGWEVRIADPVGSVRRASGGEGEVEFLEAMNGERGIALAWRHRPEIVVADEIASRAGAFALARELKGASKSMYESMSEEQLEDFASTKRKGKPEHVR